MVTFITLSITQYAHSQCKCELLTNPLGTLVRSTHVTSSFGMRIHPFTGDCSFHRGIDIAAPRGTRILPIAPGTVIKVEKQKYYGNLIVIDHGNGITSLYAHIWETIVEEGDKVGFETMIGKVGMSGRTTGPHLHFELHIVGEHIDPTKAEELFRQVK